MRERVQVAMSIKTFPQGGRLPLVAPRPGPGDPVAQTAAAQQQEGRPP